MNSKNSRKGNEKRQRVLTALNRLEPDRVPIGEWFWGTFIDNCRKDFNQGQDFDPYRYFDLDLIVINPNMDPHIQPFEILEESDEHVTVKTGWGATVKKIYDYPMPMYLDFDTKSVDAIEKFIFDDPLDPRRYREGGDDMINGVGDGFYRNLPAFINRVESYHDDFCVFGSVCEPFETLWRIIGSENALIKLVEVPDVLHNFIKKIGDYMLNVGIEQIKTADGLLSGLYMWGDVAYRQGMLFSPDIWRTMFLPEIQKMCTVFKDMGMKIIYHGCGRAQPIFNDLIEAGIDAYNPLEAKADLDVVELKKEYGDRWGFNGNIDIRVLESGDRDAIKHEVLRKLSAAKGGGYIFQSDHSVSGEVSPASYAYAIELVKEYGTYPIEIPDITVTVKE